MDNILDDFLIDKLEKLKEIGTKFNEVGQVCLLYNKGANAEACMKRITNIVLETLNESKETE